MGGVGWVGTLEIFYRGLMYVDCNLQLFVYCKPSGREGGLRRGRGWVLLEIYRFDIPA